MNSKSDKTILQSDLAGIEYAGLAGVSQPCKQVIIRLIQFGDKIHQVKILSCGQNHCMLLKVNYDDHIAVKSGFTSGYGGEGPSAFAVAIALLERHGAEIDEYLVTSELIDRVDHSCLLQSDIDEIETARPIRPQRWHDYARNYWDMPEKNELLNDEFPQVIPFGIVDSRIVDIALKFVDDSDQAIISGYRRLEDIIRNRSGLSGESGNRLFTNAFVKDDAPLTWDNIESSERKARGMLFSNVYSAFRNRRAHREPDPYAGGDLQELLLLNQLFLLEKEAVDVSSLGEDRMP